MEDNEKTIYIRSELKNEINEKIELSKEQEIAIKKFNKGENLFITGQGGTGKSFLIKYFIKNAPKEKDIKVTALTGTAALLLNCNATTIHSWSGIKIARGTIDEVIKSTYNLYNAKKNWRSVNILIIDEVSMMSQKIFEILEKLGRIMNRKYSNIPFGGIQVIFCGDFFQLPPVPNIDDPLTEKYCFESPIWKEVFKKENHIELKTVFRQKDVIYKLILSKIRKGEIDEESSNKLKTRLYLKPPKDLQITKLYPTLKLVEIENKRNFDLIESDIYEYEYYVNTNNKLYMNTGTLIPLDIIKECKESLKRNPEIINYEVKNLLTNSRCIERLQLKKGAFVMSTVNLNLDKGICNGSQGEIIEINEINGIPIPRVKFYNDVIMDISYYPWQSETYPIISIKQIPLMLAWAVSIHKSQGATLKYAEIDIGNSIFAEGQIYVGLSRIESLDGLYLNEFNPEKIKVNKNVLKFYEEFCE